MQRLNKEINDGFAIEQKSRRGQPLQLRSPTLIRSVFLRVIRG